MAWIHTVDPEDAKGASPRLEREYEAAVARAGRVYNVVRLSSIAPAILEAWIELYRRVLYGPSPLSRVERELLAVVVSAENGCHY